MITPVHERAGIVERYLAVARRDDAELAPSEPRGRPLERHRGAGDHSPTIALGSPITVRAQLAGGALDGGRSGVPQRTLC